MTNDSFDEAFDTLPRGMPGSRRGGTARGVHQRSAGGRRSPRTAESAACRAAGHRLAHRSGHEARCRLDHADSGVGATEKAAHLVGVLAAAVAKFVVRRSRRSGGDRPGHRPGRCDGSRSGRSPSGPHPGAGVGRGRVRDAGRAARLRRRRVRHGRAACHAGRRQHRDRTSAQDGEPPAETPAQAEFGRQVSERAQAGGVDGQRSATRPAQPPSPQSAPSAATELPHLAAGRPAAARPAVPGSPADGGARTSLILGSVSARGQSEPTPR